MSVTIANIITNLDTYLGDTSTDRISTAERYQAITEATVWLQEELGNEHMMATYTLEYLDGVHYYKVTSALADLLVGGDLRRGESDHLQSFARKSPREIAEDIGQGYTDPSWAVERRDGDAYLVVNYAPKYQAQLLAGFDSTTDGGTWTAYSNGDAENLTADSGEFTQGSGSLNFDIDVSNSVNNFSTVYATDAPEWDLSVYEDTSSFVFDIYIPDVTYTTSVLFSWGSDAVSPATKANYWSYTATTDINGNAFTAGWNKVKIDWADASVTGSPDVTSIVYFEFRVNYGASQPDDTDYRLDNLFIVKPERLTFHYVSWNVGRTSGGTDISAFTATTDIPFFSGQYDQYKYAVAHKAASILFYSPLRLLQQGVIELGEAEKALARYRKRFESSVTRESKSFKPAGINLRRRRMPR